MTRSYTISRFFVFISITLACISAYAVIDQPITAHGFASWRNLSEAEYSSKLAAYKKKGYRPVDVEILGGNKRTYSVVFRQNKDRRAWAIHTRLTHKQFNKKWTEYKNKGFRPVDQESYRYKGKQYYAGIWIKNTENVAWASFRNLSNDAFKKKFEEYRKKNFMPIDVDGYKNGSKFHYSVIWVKNKEGIAWKLWRNISGKRFGEDFKKFTKEGFRLFDTESYQRGVKQQYATIWVKEKKGRAWKARRDMTSNGFHNWWNRYRDLGYRLEDVEAYSTLTGTRYAGVWVKNSDIMHWSKKDKIDTTIESYLKKNKSAGCSVGIAYKGKIKYLRGFGKADRIKNKDAHSDTIYRLASVSKALSGVIAFRLQKKGKLSISKKTRFYEPRIPSHHKHTVGDLLANRGRVRHYKNGDPVNSKGKVTQYNNAYTASKLFSKDPLVSDKYKYSTHGYTLAAAAMEKATGKTFPQLIQSEISTPLRLSSLRAEFKNANVKERSKLYTGGGLLPATRDNLSWKYAGGGMESNARDLLKLGLALVNYRLLSKAEFNTMTTKPDSLSSYAYGWDTGSDSGTKVVAKSGAQTGARSYVRMYPDKKHVIVLLCNTRGDGISGLGRDIGKILLK